MGLMTIKKERYQYTGLIWTDHDISMFIRSIQEGELIPQYYCLINIINIPFLGGVTSDDYYVSTYTETMVKCGKIRVANYCQQLKTLMANILVLQSPIAIVQE